MKPFLHRLLDFAIRHSAKVGILGYIGGLIWLLSLAYPSMNNKTYFSENALLSGMVDTNYNSHHTAKALKGEVENPSENYREDFPAWLMDKMTSIGLEAYKQNFTIKFPEEISDKGNVIGTNVYGILRAPRIAGTEALVFSIPFKGESSEPFYELVLLLSLAEHFRNNVYWSKDIIFLMIDQKELGMQTWLNEYHGIKTDYVESSPMLGRSGAIQAAINLDLESKDISRMEIMMEGLNGQLPNLDLVNMVIHLCEMERIPVFLKKQDFNFANDGWDEYRSALSTMGTMMFSQASGRPSSNHGLFLKYGIEAVTLKGIKQNGESSVGFGRLGRALEGMFRSLNNLLERFHQSFFFYLLSSTHRYISIGLYMPPLGCLMVGPILVAVACWVWSVAEDETKKHKKVSKDDESGEINKTGNNESKGNEEKEQSTEKAEEKDSEKIEQPQEEVAFTRIPRHFGKVLRVFLAGHFVGLLIYVTPLMSRYIRPIPFDFEPFRFSIVALIVSFLFSLVLPLLLSISTNLTTRDVMLLKSLALVVYTCSVGCLATVNFSFGYFLAVFTAPSFLLAGSTKNRFRRLIQVVLVFLSSPPSILFLLTFIYSYLTSQNVHNIEQLPYDSTTLFTNSLLSSLCDSFLLGAWSYAVTTLILIPNWLIFWCIAWA